MSTSVRVLAPQDDPKNRLASSSNAVKHGLTAQRLFLLDNESREEAEAHYQAWVASLRPRSTAEAQVANEIASAYWKLKRLEAMERAIAREAADRAIEDSAPMKALRSLRGAKEGLLAFVRTAGGLVAHQYHPSLEELLGGARGVADMLEAIDGLPLAKVVRFQAAISQVRQELLDGTMTFPSAFPDRLAGIGGQVLEHLERHEQDLERKVAVQRDLDTTRTALMDDKVTRRLDRYRSHIEASIQRQIAIYTKLRELPAAGDGDAIPVEFKVIQV